MGLHLQRDQEIPSESRFRLAGPISRHNDSPFHGRLRSASHQNVPQTRGTCHG